MKKSMEKTVKKEDEMTAIKALSFLASEPERLGRFLSLTGLGPQTLRQAAREPAFLAQVLDYLCADEALLVTFAENAALKPEQIARARTSLAGPPPDGSV